MIYSCPFCGRTISRVIRDGITTCNNCGRVFDSSSLHKILAAAWLVRLHHVEDIETIKANYELSDEEAAIIKQYIIDLSYSHDEFLKVVNRA